MIIENNKIARTQFFFVIKLTIGLVYLNFKNDKWCSKEWTYTKTVKNCLKTVC